VFDMFPPTPPRVIRPGLGPRPRDPNTHYVHGVTPPPPPPNSLSAAFGPPPPVTPTGFSPDLAAAMLAAIAQQAQGGTVNPLGIGAHSMASGGLGGEGDYGGDDYAHAGWGTAPPIPFSVAHAAATGPARGPAVRPGGQWELLHPRHAVTHPGMGDFYHPATRPPLQHRGAGDFRHVPTGGNPFPHRSQLPVSPLFRHGY